MHFDAELPRTFIIFCGISNATTVHIELCNHCLWTGLVPCQFVAGELEKKLEEGTTAAVGVHGMSGMGKTMLCKALCNNFKQRFYGRVCYVDFGSGDTIGIKKEILRRLTDLKSEFILDQYRYEEQVQIFL